MPINKAGLPNIKERIHRGETLSALSLPVTTGKEDIEAALSRGSYDFIATDAQHAACDEERLVAFCEAATELGFPVKLRIKHTDHAYLVGTTSTSAPAASRSPR